MKIFLNNQTIETNQSSGSTLLDFIRYDQRLMGTKVVCREGDCGACSVLVGELEGDAICYKHVCSCLVPLGEMRGRHVITIEGLNQPNGLNPIQQALVNHGAVQCGFCTPGFVVAMTSYFLNAKAFTQKELLSAMSGNICRCTGYVSIKNAAFAILKEFAPKLKKAQNRLEALVAMKVLPSYFLSAASLLKETHRSYKSYGSYKTYIGGGTDLYVQKAGALVEAEPTFLLNSKQLKRIWSDKTHLYIGGAVTTDALQQSCEFKTLLPQFEGICEFISSQPIRNRATLAGNIINASPIADLAILFLSLSAEVCLEKGKSKRILPLNKLYLGYKQLDLKKEECLVWIRVPLSIAKYKLSFEKVAKRPHLDIASVNSTMAVFVEKGVVRGMQISAGGVYPYPLLLSQTGRTFVGQRLTVKGVETALKVLDKEIRPISDVRGSADYKRILLRQLIRAHFIKLFPKVGLERGIA